MIVQLVGNKYNLHLYCSANA